MDMGGVMRERVFEHMWAASANISCTSAHSDQGFRYPQTESMDTSINGY